MSQAAPPSKAELLAPAGSLEAFFAAVDAGADAVYTGLKDFSARAKAKNFSLADIERMTSYLHAEKKRLYVTLNTLIRENELSHLIDTLSALESFAVDAVIIQDLAIWKLIREHFPGLDIHASTQMTIHNVAGVRTLEGLGFTRAVLARELTLAEITFIRSQTELELEHFIHGALCFSFSGQCYFSSFLGGRSGNRGRCAQPCRRSYRHHQQQGFYFSPNDLSAIDLLPELEAAGICSFKIEGRMKSAEYVHKVVGAYRSVMNAPASERKKVLAEAKQLLKESFGRQPTHGFLAGKQPEDMAIPSQKGATGRFVGKIHQVQGKRLSFTSTAPLRLGDRLRIQPVNDKSGSAFTLRQLFAGPRPVNKTPAGKPVTVISPFDQGFWPGDSVFMVASADAYTLSDSAARRKLEQGRTTGERVDLYLEVTPEQLRIRATIGGQTADFSYPITSFPAIRQPLEADILQQVFAAVADEPFILNRLTCAELPAVVIPPKELKQLRRTFYRDLRLTRQQVIQRRRHDQRQAALGSLLENGPGKPQSPQLRVLVGDTREQHLLSNELVDGLLIPLHRHSVEHADKLKRRADRIIWDLPFILFDQDWRDYQAVIRSLHGLGFRHFRLSNLGHFPLFEGLEELRLYSSFRLFALNSLAICAWAELGIIDVELYIEDDRDNMAAILSRKLPIPASLMIYGRAPLLTSRIQIRQIRGAGLVLSDRDDAYRVQHRQGLTWLYSETPFSFIARKKDLEELGCNGFILDLSFCGSNSATGKQVLQAVSQKIDPDGCSGFNFDKGLE